MKGRAMLHDHAGNHAISCDGDLRGHLYLGKGAALYIVCRGRRMTRFFKSDALRKNLYLCDLQPIQNSAVNLLASISTRGS